MHLSFVKITNFNITFFLHAETCFRPEIRVADMASDVKQSSLNLRNIYFEALEIVSASK